MDKILTATTYRMYELGNDWAPTVNILNISGYTRSVSGNLITVGVNSLNNEGTNTTRGFYVSAGGKHHRVKYSFEYMFAPKTAGETSVMNSCGFEGTTTVSLTFTPEWKTATGLFTRTNYSSPYAAFTWYRKGTSIALGTYYIRNLVIEPSPWVYTIGGKPLKVSV